MLERVVDWWKENPKTRKNIAIVIGACLSLFFFREDLRRTYDAIPEQMRLPFVAILFGSMVIGCLYNMDVLKLRTSNKSWNNEKT